MSTLKKLQGCKEVMRSQTNEEALENHIETSLLSQGFIKGDPNDFNKEFAIDTVRFWHFLETTQDDELKKLQRDPSCKQKILSRFDKLMKKYGIMRLIKKGLDIDDAHFTLLYVAALHNSGEETVKRFDSNEWSVTRQVRYSTLNPLQEIDMVLFVNGIPLITMELKNIWTGQNAKVHGIKQYKNDRDPHQPLLNPSRCIVHFALDTDEAYMTTKLDGVNTFFLPFNKGNNHGKGNPVNQHGHKTAYMWEEIFTKSSLAGILQHFVRMSGKEGDALSQRILLFPRYHQLNVVRRITKSVTTHGAGKSYLIQHSAGSGKSNSIAWAAYQLIECSQNGEQNPLFNSVIVVVDRRLLDKQLLDTITAFAEVKSIVAHATSAQDLKQHINNGKKIIITTIQKFPFIVDGMADMSDKRFAVIIDEAHSSQSGTAHDKMNETIGKEDEDAQDGQDMILEAMKKRKMKGNVSYLAFTATPKNNTLEKFGEKQSDGTFEPFHLYSMKQAIEEGFILDVLANYTTYKSYYQIEKSIEDNPLFDTKKAQGKLRAYVEAHEETIGTKTEIILEHFSHKIVASKKLKGKAKGMVVTQNIQTAIHYYHAIQKKLDEMGNPFKAIIAFSGEKELKGINYTEESLNGFASSDISEKFESDEYRLLVVANKFLTGFDQPKLTAMYVDKKLQGVLAVQALSRLNRSANKLGKKTEDLFVLDFFNKVDDIKTSFDPFYTATSLSGATDVNVLHDLKAMLDDTRVYEPQEVELFVQKYFNRVDASELAPIIDFCAFRFNEEFHLDDKAKADIKIKAKQFVKIYGQIASIIPYEIVAWEKLFWFLKFLIPKLIINDNQETLIDALLESVDLSTYGLERVKLNSSIELDEGEGILDPQNPNPRGAHDESESDVLDTIIKSFNDRWFQGWENTPEEQKIKILTIAQKIKEHHDYKTKYEDNIDAHTRDLAFVKILDDIMNKQRRSDMELYKLRAQDEAFNISFENILKQVLTTEPNKRIYS